MHRGLLALAVFVCLAASPGMAQDPVKVDPKRYKVEFENDQVRVLRIHYGPHEKSVMHSHPAGVAVFLTDGDSKFIFPDGTSVVRTSKGGQVRWTAGETHLPENLSDSPSDVVLVELKAEQAPREPPRRIRIPGDIQQGYLVRLVQPVYPAKVRFAGIEGTVVFHAVVATDGTVKQLVYLSGPLELAQPAADAVEQWRYRRVLLNGEPVEVDTTISVVFVLGRR